ncbi:MAG TPA: beta-L-arabinofuranosidase domain-containing protein [Bryobacteraceae bacterium]|jgi:hypothetical protein|nr:beta-L-arabinofuranosidase domain-containing protein [Bryobacteraceae bacterium]
MKSLPAILLVAGIAAGQDPAWRDKPVLDTSKSAFAVLHGVPVSAVTVRDGFWSPRRKAAISVSLPTFLELMEQNGEIDNFRRLSGRKKVARRGRIPTDADVYKWLEAVAFAIESGDADAHIRKAAEGVIDDIAAGQDASGYMVSAFMGEQAIERHTGMARNHELYIFGHMLQAGIAWYRASGDRKLLDVGVRMAGYLLRNFGIGKKPIFEGHPEVELALVELFRTIPDRRYLELAGYFLDGDARNMQAVRPADLIYLFTVEPFTDRTRFEGHAVRAMYAVSGATDYFLETGNRKYWSTLTNLWEDMVRHKMYVTGGVGSRSQGEAFGDPYELPNKQAYAESCAAIGNVFWNWRLLQATGDGKYTDVLERALYNGANSGLSLDGRLYCYRNPLEVGGQPDEKIRNAWYSTPCCPPNLERILASLPGYFYSTSKDGVWVHLFDNSEVQWKLEDGTAIKLSQQTRYPWDGKVTIAVTPASPKEFTVFVRRPSWAASAKLEVAGAAAPAPLVEKGYFAIRRTWKPGDRVTIEFGLTPRLTAANPLVRDDIGKVAVERGPLVYTAEGLDQPVGTTVFDWQLAVSPGVDAFQSVWKPEMLGGIVTLVHPAVRPAAPNREQPLYQELAPGQYLPGEITLIPYYTLQNREPTSMAVWIPYREKR